MNNEERLNDLERRIKELENANQRLGPSPITWPLPPDHIDTYPGEECMAGCKTCGMKFDGPMGYVCHHPCCPSRIAF
jgi:hypothetical protein